MGRIPQKYLLPLIKRRTRNMPCQCHLPVSYFLMKTALQIFIILHASYAWDTGFSSFRLLIAQYKLYGMILFICHNA